MRAKTEKQLREELKALREHFPGDPHWTLTVWVGEMAAGSDSLRARKVVLKAQLETLKREAAAQEAAELLRQEYYRSDS